MQTTELTTPELKPDALEPPDFLRQRMEERVEITLTVPRSDVEKLQAFMQSDRWEKAQELRKADLQGCLKSLQFCVDVTLHHDYSTAVSIARILVSLYNGNRVQADMSRIYNFDSEHFEHMMNVLRLCFDTHQEPHTFFKDGGRLFEHIIQRHGLEKRRRK